MPENQQSPQIHVEWLEIDDSHAGQRLDNYLLGHLKGVPKGRVYRMIRSGEVRVNKGRRRPDYRLRQGDTLRVPPVRRSGPSPVRHKQDFSWLESRILFEDKRYLVLDKPSGMAVHGGSGLSLGVIEAMRQLRSNERFLELGHRLDRETSGCLVIAKRRSALLHLHEQLRNNSTDKRYLALVQGGFKSRKAIHVKAPLDKRVVRGERHVVVSEEGRPSHSVIRPQQQFRTSGLEASLIEIALKTGRTHQARAHCAHIEHAIAGDDRYGEPDFNELTGKAGLKRLFLHAASITFDHPEHGKMTVEAPLPEELKQVMENLLEQNHA